jgi:hypothetical protein
MLSQTQTLEGFTSKIGQDKHVILLDVENCSLEQCRKELRFIQKKYNLSDIFITSDYPNSFHGFCFNIVDFKTYLRIQLDVEHLDYNFFFYTVKRSKATIRTGLKKGREKQKIISVLKSYSMPNPFFSSRIENCKYDTGLDKKGVNLILG